jgi:hypothetical protein
MIVPVMNVRVVRMTVRHDEVLMKMAVLAAPTPPKPMGMLVVFIVGVFMLMLQFLVNMLVRVVLGKV